MQSARHPQAPRLLHATSRAPRHVPSPTSGIFAPVYTVAVGFFTVVYLSEAMLSSVWQSEQSAACAFYSLAFAVKVAMLTRKGARFAATQQLPHS